MVSRRTYFSVVSNAVYVAFGPVLTILGAYMMWFYQQFIPLVDQWTWMMPMIFMILGVATIILSVFACLQLATEFLCSAIFYFIFVVMLILALIGLGAFWVHVTPSYPGFVNNTFDRAYSSYEDFQVHQAWAVLQTELQCCGLNGMADFESIHVDVPIDCCKNKTVTICAPEDMILDGCLHAFLYRVYVDRYALGIIAIIAGTLMLLMLVGSMFVCFEDDDVEPRTDGDAGYCMDDEPDMEGHYFEAIHTDNREKHPAFGGGVDLTYIPEQPSMQQQTIIVQPQPQPSTSAVVPIMQQAPPVVIEEVGAQAVIPSMAPPPIVTHTRPIHQRLVRVVRKLPMLERRARMRYCVKGPGGNCRRCSHVSKCKFRQSMPKRCSISDSTRSMRGSRVSIGGSRTSMRRMSKSPEHLILDAPRAKGKFICRKMRGRTLCRAMPL